MKNPFPTEADWNEFVKKYDIPAKITKAHAKKVIGLRKAFGKAGLESGAASTIPSASAKAAKELVEQAARVAHEFARSLDLESGLAKEDLHPIKHRWQTLMLQPIETLNNVIKKLTDPFAQSRANAAKAVEEYKGWLNDKSNADKLVHMFGQSLRNHLGANINSPKGTLSPVVKVLVNEYQELCKHWYQPLLNESAASKVVSDPQSLKKLETDLKRLVELGLEILQKTKT